MFFADKLSDNCALLLITVGNDLCVVPQRTLENKEQISQKQKITIDK